MREARNPGPWALSAQQGPWQHQVEAGLSDREVIPVLPGEPHYVLGRGAHGEKLRQEVLRPSNAICLATAATQCPLNQLMNG